MTEVAFSPSPRVVSSLPSLRADGSGLVGVAIRSNGEHAERRRRIERLQDELQDSLAEEAALELQIAQKRSLALLQASRIAALENQAQGLDCKQLISAPSQSQFMIGSRDASVGAAAAVKSATIMGSSRDGGEACPGQPALLSSVGPALSGNFAQSASLPDSLVAASTPPQSGVVALGAKVEAQPRKLHLSAEAVGEEENLDSLSREYGPISPQAARQVEDDSSDCSSGEALSLEDAMAQLSHWKDLDRQVRCLEIELSSRGVEVADLSAEIQSLTSAATSSAAGVVGS